VLVATKGAGMPHNKRCRIEDTYLVHNNAELTKGGEDGSFNGSITAPKTSPIMLTAMVSWARLSGLRAPSTLISSRKNQDY
jgi:hypothetical protein